MTKPAQTFLSRHMVAIVMIPTIIGIHIGWNMMQNNRQLVTAEEQIELPAVTFAKYLGSKLSGDSKKTVDTPDTVK